MGIASEARNKGVLVYASVYLPQEFGISDKADPRPSLRIVVTRMHTKEQLEKCANVVKALLLDAVEKRNGYKMDEKDDLLLIYICVSFTYLYRLRLCSLNFQFAGN